MEERNFKILIAGENIQFRDTLAARLRVLGFSVDLVTGGFHLIHSVEVKQDFNLVIIHENMNDMPAEEMISLIRLNKKKSELPILFISNKNDEEEVYDLVIKGANEYMVKTPNFQHIVDRANKYFNLLKNHS